MGKIKHLPLIMKLFKSSPVVAVRDVAMLTGSRQYAYLLLHWLEKKGRIKRLVKGYYTIHDDPTLTVFCYRPAYIGLQDALSIHNLWTQETTVVIITTRNIRGDREVMGAKVVIHRLNPKYYFGYQYVRYGDIYIPVSDIEKTIIDLAYYNQPVHQEVIQEASRSISTHKLKEYLQRYNSKVKARIIKKLKTLLQAINHQ